MSEEKQKLLERNEKDLKKEEVNCKIERSKNANAVRIDKMQKTNAMVEELLVEAKHEMHRRLSGNQEEYRTLIRQLLVQGFIKMFETNMILKVRKSDLELIESEIEQAKEIYTEKMLSEVELLKGRTTLKCKVEIDRTNFLPEWNPATPQNSCLGGFEIYAKKNRIVCSQTLDDRMALVFAQAIPAIRATLFPSLLKRK